MMLTDLRLPTIKVVWPQFAQQADKEGWPAARFLAALAEHELAERDRRRIERHLAEARLPPGKTLDSFDFTAVPMISRAQVTAVATGDAWLDKGANLLLLGPPGGGKSHLAAAIGLALVENGWKILFTRTTDLVQNSRSPVANWRSKPPSTGWTASTYSSSTIEAGLMQGRREQVDAGQAPQHLAGDAGDDAGREQRGGGATPRTRGTACDLMKATEC